MSMNVYVIRHAIAEERDPARWPDDSRRPLSPEGEARFRSAARGLRRLVPEVDVVFASRYVRAWHTAEILHEEAGWPAPEPAPVLEPSFPHAAVELLQGRADRSIALVGHEPHLSELTSLLVSGDEHALGLELKKGATVLLELAVRPAAGTATLRWIATPKILRMLDSSK
jgi:phosphohistidine phosphatase